jgi:hypothetical protein
MVKRAKNRIYRMGTPGTLRVFSGIFFLYNFLVRLSGNKGTSARSARKIYSGSSGTLPAYSGIFFLYIFLVRLSGKQVQCAGSAGG